MMELFGFDLPGWILAPLALVAVVAAQVWLEQLSAAEEKKNEQNPSPNDEQVRWHIRHIRQDVRLIAVLLTLILITLLLKK
jgi:hypothetical protein